jgi:oxalate decarboxylase
MRDIDRRLLIGGIATGAGVLAAVRAFAAAPDGHAAGNDAARSAEFMPLVPRWTGDPMQFTAVLDKAALKASSEGWACKITTRQLPPATGIADAHRSRNPGDARETHWHNSAERAHVLDGACQVTVVGPEGQAEVASFRPGDIRYFRTSHAHAIQTTGAGPAMSSREDGRPG